MQIAFPNDAQLIESPEEMHALGAQVASLLNGHEVLALCGNLGAGKTHFTQGLVAALGIGHDAHSPSFGLVHEYVGGKFDLFHFDFYRIKHAAEADSIGWDDYLSRDGLIVVEWANSFPELMPPDTIWLEFAHVEHPSQRRVTGLHALNSVA